MNTPTPNTTPISDEMVKAFLKSENIPQGLPSVEEMIKASWIFFQSYSSSVEGRWRTAPIKQEPPETKPPLGIIPEWLWKEKRLEELRTAIKRYAEANQAIPINWIVEEYCLREWIEDKRGQDKQPGDAE